MTEQSILRLAGEADIAPMVALSKRQWAEYQRFQPTFWRRAADADDRQRAILQQAIAAGQGITRVAEWNAGILGFLVARLIGAPPVYDPGGLTCFSDDFVVSGAGRWPVDGARLLSEVCREAKARGAVQAVVTCPRMDEPKRQMLASLGFSIASEWHVRTCADSTELPRTAGRIRRAVPADVVAMVDLSEQRRWELQSYQPIFWRKARDSQAKHLPFLAQLVQRDDAIALVHERGSRVDGFVTATLDSGPPTFDRGGPTRMVDDFMVAEPLDWPSTGAALLVRAVSASREKGAKHIQVVSARGNRLKGQMLAALGFSLALEWHVKEVRDL